MEEEEPCVVIVRLSKCLRLSLYELYLFGGD